METNDIKKIKKEIFTITSNAGTGTPSEDDLCADGVGFGDYELGFVTCAKAIEVRLEALFAQYEIESNSNR